MPSTLSAAARRPLAAKGAAPGRSRSAAAWLLRCALPLGLVATQASSLAQTPMAPPEGVLTMSASATVEVPKDWMSMAFSVTREGADSGVVQSQLKQAVDAALAEARRIAKPGQVEVKTGAFSIYPRYGQKGTMSGWQGSTELLVEGRDMDAIAKLSGRISSMTISRVGYGLSREAREKVDAEVTGQAIARFRARAAELAKQFGYAGFVLREVNVSSDEQGGVRPMARDVMMMKAASAEALPVEAGNGTVTATVQGSIQMK